MIDAFIAGDDLALMPVPISKPSDIEKLDQLFTAIIKKVNDDKAKCKTSTNHQGLLCESDIDASVLRILTLKKRLKLLNSPWHHNLQVATPARALETDLANHSVTLVQNNHGLLPITLHRNERIHILTPWGEQGAAIAQEIKTLQAAGSLPQGLTVTHDKISATTEAAQKVKVNNADLIIVGGLAKGSVPLSSLTAAPLTTTPYSSPVVFPDMPIGDSTQLGSIASPNLYASQDGVSDAQFAYDILRYAHTWKKTTLFISVLSPYDLPLYRDVADAMLVGYDYYGYLETSTGDYFRGPAMQAITRTLFKDVKTKKAINIPTAKLPVNVPDPNDVKEIIYARGFGLSY